MNGKKLSVREFMAEYGRVVPLSGNDEITVFEGTDIASIRNYLSSAEFTDASGMDGLLGGTKGAVMTMSRDTTDYGKKIFGNGLKGDVASTLLKSLGIEALYKKTIGNTLPVEGREHARVYNLGDGKVAVLQHKDPGMGHYAKKGPIGGLMELALYHFGLVDMSGYKKLEAAA